MSAPPQGPTRYQRIEANCKKIWGADKEFDIDIETDDYEHYACVVKEDRGLSFSSPLTMTNFCNGPDRAWEELDRMLRTWARQVESGRPMTREECLEIFSGPNGRHRNFLEAFLNKKDEMDVLATAKKA
jgi:hypothetical protein